jgi:hypothetical protein
MTPSVTIEYQFLVEIITHEKATAFTSIRITLRRTCINRDL